MTKIFCDGCRREISSRWDRVEEPKRFIYEFSTGFVLTLVVQLNNYSMGSKDHICSDCFSEAVRGMEVPKIPEAMKGA